MAKPLVVEVPDGLQVTELTAVLSGVFGRLGYCLGCRSGRDIIFTETVESTQISPENVEVFRYDPESGALTERR